MAETIHLAVICYDVSDSADRRRVAAQLETHMVRVQDSVFEGWMSMAKAHEVLTVVSGIIDASDSVRCYIVPRASVVRCRASGFPPAPMLDGVLIL